MKTKIFLVTGAAGFIGSNLVSRLLSDGSRVRAFDDFSTGRSENLRRFSSHADLQVIRASILDQQALKKAVAGVDFVLHQAALPSVPRSVKDPVGTSRVNIEGTLNVLEAARLGGVERVVFASSSSVYGDSEILPKVESMTPCPRSPYAVSKLAAEKYCQVYYDVFGLETVSLRYFNVFGPNQDPTSTYSAVIPKFIAALTQGEIPQIYGDGMHSRDFTFVENNVEANLLACRAKGVAGRVFNIACGERFTLLDLLERLADLLNVPMRYAIAAPRAGDVRHSEASIELARSELGFEPRVSFSDGLEKTVSSFEESDRAVG